MLQDPASGPLHRLPQPSPATYQLVPDHPLGLSPEALCLGCYELLSGCYIVGALLLVLTV